MSINGQHSLAISRDIQYLLAVQEQYSLEEYGLALGSLKTVEILKIKKGLI